MYMYFFTNHVMHFLISASLGESASVKTSDNITFLATGTTFIKGPPNLLVKTARNPPD